MVHDFISLQVTAIHGYFTTIWAEQINTKQLVASGASIDQIHTSSLCVKKSNGTEICLNGDQLELILSSAPVNTIPPVQSPVPETSSGASDTGS